MKNRFIFIGLIFLLGSCHVGRMVIWNFADVRDYKKFQKLPVANSPAVHPFQTGISAAYDTATITMDGKKTLLVDLLKQTKTQAFLIIRNDSLIYERYFKRKDNTSIHPSFSVAKSFVATLVGIAIDEGHIRSVKDSITRYLPYLDRTTFGKITIEHVLDMRSGVRFNESYINPFGDAAKYYYGRNLKKYIRKLKVKHGPGGPFDYNSVNTQLLGMIVEQATGKPLATYLEEKLWKPLGMEYPASWSIDSKKHQQVKAFCCLNARARDYAKLGQLYLQEGQWEGKTIVSRDWVKRTSTYTGVKNNFRYLNHWWHRSTYEQVTDSTDLSGPHYVFDYTNNAGKTSKVAVKPRSDYYAQGILGQFIYIHPESQTVIVRLGKKYGIGSWQWAQLFSAIAEAGTRN